MISSFSICMLAALVSWVILTTQNGRVELALLLPFTRFDGVFRVDVQSARATAREGKRGAGRSGPVGDVCVLRVIRIRRKNLDRHGRKFQRTLLIADAACAHRLVLGLIVTEAYPRESAFSTCKAPMIAFS
jgi:inactivated superfamily I helicase